MVMYDAEDFLERLDIELLLAGVSFQALESANEFSKVLHAQAPPESQL